MAKKEAIDRECDERLAQYRQALRKHEELLSQFVQIAPVEPGKQTTPKRAFDETAIKEIQRSEQELENAGRKFQECLDRLWEAYHRQAK